MNDINRYILLKLTVIVVIFYSAATIFMSLSPMVIVNILGDHKYSGLPGAIFLIVGALVTPFAVRGIEKYGATFTLRVALLTGISGALFAYIGHSQHSSVYLLVGLGLMGATGAVVVLSRAVVTEILPPKKQANAMATIMLGAVAGGLLSPIFYKLTSHSHASIELSWLYVAMFFALGLTFLTKSMALKIKKAKEEILLERTQQSERIVTKQTMPNKGLSTFVLLIGVLGHAVMLSIMSISGHVMHDSQIEISLIYYAMGIHFVGMFGSMPVAAFLYRNLRFKRSIFISLFLYIITIYLYSQSHLAISFFFSLWLLGAAWSICFLSVSLKLSEVSIVENRIRIIARHDILASLMGILLTLVSGVTYTENGKEGLLFLILLILLTMLTLITIYSIRERIKFRIEES